MAMDEGCLAELEVLSLQSNKISGVGLQALAGALSEGAVPKFRSLLLDGNNGLPKLIDLVGMQVEHASDDVVFFQPFCYQLGASWIHQASCLDHFGPIPDQVHLFCKARKFKKYTFPAGCREMISHAFGTESFHHCPN